MDSSQITHDYDLTASEVRELGSADAIKLLFHNLHYDVNQTQDFEKRQLGMDGANLSREINLIRRIAVDPIDGDIQIYLFEMRHVNIALTQLIARNFKGGDSYLLILTTNYDKLDFVLLDRQITKTTSGEIKPTLRPRTLTVNRLNPDPVTVRVLKRFTCTELDSLYQWDKLRSAYMLAEWTETDFNNRALFSDYYLKKRLPVDSVWNDKDEPFANRWFDVIGLMENARDRLADKPEAVTRAELIEPLFELLGFEFVEGKASNSQDKEPDYRLYRPGEMDKPVALALTYKWNRNLDSDDYSRKERVRDVETPAENPGVVVASLLEKAEADWVIVTNGKLWRLYAAKVSNKVTNYYEVDLEEALFAPERERDIAFKYWWLMFRQQAFPDFLNNVIAESAKYAKEIGDRLKGRIFEVIFPYFGRGFVRTIRQQHGIAREDIDLDQVFTGTLTFLYRLMFLLYAESLDLLPIKEADGYGAISLDAIKHEIARVAGDIEKSESGLDRDTRIEQHYTKDSTTLYQRLKKLFSVINEGSKELNLPVYNGGLFSPTTDSGQFLETYAIPDVLLAQGLDRLTRDIDTKGTHALVMIDFKSLGVRQLGSIYEGLLEFKLKLAREPLAIVREKSREVYMKHDDAVKQGKRIVEELQTGQFYLENTKQERKATGSYYTPDYIVKYIVEHTVGPVLEEKTKSLEERMRKAQKEFREHKKRVAARGNDQPAELFWNSPEMEQLADDCLNIRVLDPAMGSGHFLVEVVDFISNRLIDWLNGWSENPVWAMLDRARTEILQEMHDQGVSIDRDRLTDVALLKRAVLKRCIYGVDLNPMAVELAKVSLWLNAFTLGAPLSFLDHHLKCGNSLIGVRVEEVRTALAERKQRTFWDTNAFAGLMLGTDLMRQVSYQPDTTIAQANASRDAYRSASDHLAPYKRILDVYTSRWFGNVPSKKKNEIFDPTLEFLGREDIRQWLENPDTALPANDYMNSAKVAETALAAAEDKHFFHWELEFPEIFFAPSTPGGQDVQLRPDAGFDAVVGNPPYDELSEDSLGRGIDERGFLSDSIQYLPIQNSGGRLNWYHCFMVLGINWLTSCGINGFIVPMSWLGDSFTKGVRIWLLTEHTPLTIDAFPQKDDPRRRVFPEAKLPTCVYITQKSRSGELKVRVHSGKDILDTEYYRADLATLRRLNPETILIPLVDPIGWQILQNVIDSQHLGRLSEYGGEPTSGEIIFNADTHPYMTEDDSYDLILRGSHIQRYELADAAKQGEPIYLKTAEYLAASRGDSKAYAHKNPRVVYQEGSAIDAWRRVVSTYLPAGYICGHKICYFINYKSEPFALLAIFGSKLTNWLVEALSATNSLPAYLISNLPYPKFAFYTAKDRRQQLLEKSHKLYKKSLNEGFGCVLEFTAHHLELGETDVIHDLLAFLAQQMIDLNKTKQAEVKRFLNWLEGCLEIKPKRDGSTGLDSLTGKSIIQNYLGDYQKGQQAVSFEDFEYRLLQNRTRFGVPLSTLINDIQDEYEKSLGTLLPIKAQLSHTDTLIDRIVYQLYGLTDDEIKLIEYPQFEQAVTTAREAAREEVLADKENKPEAVETVDKIIDAVADKVLPAAEQYFQRVEPIDFEARLREALPGWDGLPQKVRTFLLTGDYLLAQTHPDEFEFSPIVISYGKAAESALNEKWFLPFRSAGHTDRDVDNEFFQRFMRNGKPLSLGSIEIILASAATREPAFHRFVQGLYPNANKTIFARDGLLKLLSGGQINTYRNTAAHDGVMSADDANAAREWALEILRHV